MDTQISLVWFASVAQIFTLTKGCNTLTIGCQILTNDSQTLTIGNKILENLNFANMYSRKFIFNHKIFKKFEKHENLCYPPPQFFPKNWIFQICALKSSSPTIKFCYLCFWSLYRLFRRGPTNSWGSISRGGGDPC